MYHGLFLLEHYEKNLNINNYYITIVLRSPDTGPYLEKLEKEKIAKERGEDPRDNRSFLSKYVSLC